MSVLAEDDSSPRDQPMPRRPRWATDWLGWLLLAVVAYVPPMWSSPGSVVADTKQYLYLDPGRLLSRAPYLWDENIGLGTVTHQVVGYLFPMGPYYWGLETLGVPDWVAQRLWTGTIMFAAAAGVLYLFRTLGMRGPGAVAGAFVYMLSPYSLDYVSRISVILLPWAAFGFLLGLTDRSLRDGGWRYPAVFALLVQVVGGVNATALVYVGIGPVAWIVWAVLGSREVHWRRGLATVLRIGSLTALTSLWWAAGLRMQQRYGLNILEFTETVEAVARTSTPNEVLRGLGYWFFYGQDKLGPWIEAAENYTQNPARIVVGYGIAALALASAGLVRWRHRLFSIVMVLIGVVVAVGAHPFDDPSPLGALFSAFAEASQAGLALRSTGRAGPLVAMGMALLLGAGVNAACAKLSARGLGYAAFAPAVLLVGLAVFNFPALWDGTYYGENLQRDEEVPEYWREAVDALDESASDTRILELPGADFASYRWGNTVDPITPGLTDRPYVARELVPWGAPASASLVNAVDRQLQEGVAEPSGLADLARLLAVGDIVLRYDIQHERFDLVRPELLSRVVDGAPGLGEPRRFGGVVDESDTRFPRIDERALAGPADEPARSPVEVVAVEDPRTIVRTAPADGPLILAGDAEGLVEAAEAGLLAQDRLVLYSATFADDPEALADEIERDAVLVVTDSNRQRGQRWSTVRDNVGLTETRGEEPLVDDLSDRRLEVFPDEGDGALTRTFTDLGPDVEQVRASGYGTPITFLPEDRPANALDGDPLTAWRTSAFSAAIGERIRIRLPEPVTTDSVTLLQPVNGPRNRWITEVELRFDGGESVRADLDDSSRAEPGQVVAFEPRTFSELEVEITDLNVGEALLHTGTSGVGFAEIAFADSDGDDVAVAETIVMPTDLLVAAGDEAADRALVYLMSRERVPEVPPRTSPEPRMVRELVVPDEREFELGGTARLAPDAAGAVLDAATGMETDPERGGVHSRASETLPGCVHCRAGAAIDGDPETSWQTPFVGVRDQWVEFTVGEPITVDRLDLSVVADGRHSVPTRIEIDVDGNRQVVDLPAVDDVLEAGDNATVTVPVEIEPVTGRSIRLTVLDVRPTQTLEFYSSSNVDMPVGIAELGIAELSARRPGGDLDTGCRDDLVAVDGRSVPVRITGERDSAERGGALAIEQCGRVITLGSGAHRVEATAGRVSGVDVDRLLLASSPGGGPMALEDGMVSGLPPAPPASPEVTVSGHGRVDFDLSVDASAQPYWLVLAQTHSDGWSAEADGYGSLGTPTLVDGFANGWYVDPVAMGLSTDGVDVKLEWTPQRVVWAGIALSVAGVALCIALFVYALVRRRRVGARADGGASLDPWRDAGTSGIVPLGWRATAGVAVAAGLLATVLVKPWAGFLGVALTLVVARLPRTRPVIVASSAGLVALVGLYVAAAQWRNDYPPLFEWPTFFDRASVPTFAALVAIGVVAAVDWRREVPAWPARRRRDRSR